MPAQDPSLFGFYEAPDAKRYLENFCILDEGLDIEAFWHEARTRLGPPFAGAGNPEVLDIAGAHTKYLNSVRDNPRFEDTVRPFDEWDFKLVEIDPLLAYQAHIGRARSDDLCPATGGGSPTMEELLERCLPCEGDEIKITRVEETDGSISFETNSLNFRIMGTGHFKDEDDSSLFVMGAQVGASTSLVQVVSFEERCYLTNGYHRLLALRRQGARHVPCIFGKTARFAVTGAGQPYALSRTLLESRNAPTMAHYTQERATCVNLRQFTNRITVSWAQTWTGQP